MTAAPSRCRGCDYESWEYKFQIFSFRPMLVMERESDRKKGTPGGMGKSWEIRYLVLIANVVDEVTGVCTR